MSALDFDQMSDEDFADVDGLPRKPAGRNSPPSKFAPLLKSLLASGKSKTTKRSYSTRKPAGGGTSDSDQMERELRRAARQVGGKISIRKTDDDESAGTVFLSFRMSPEEAKAAKPAATPEDAQATTNGTAKTEPASETASKPAETVTPVNPTGAPAKAPVASKARANA